MPGEGSMAGALISLKNNKALLKTNRSKWKNYMGSKRQPTKKLGKMSPTEMKEFKAQLKRRKMKKDLLLIAICLVSLIITSYLVVEFFNVN